MRLLLVIGTFLFVAAVYSEETYVNDFLDALGEENPKTCHGDSEWCVTSHQCCWGMRCNIRKLVCEKATCEEGAKCRRQTDCCKGMACSLRKERCIRVCSNEDEICLGDFQCCENMSCRNNKCAKDCQEKECKDGGRCCDGMQCNRDSGMCEKKCNHQNKPCKNDSDCCDKMHCDKDKQTCEKL